MARALTVPGSLRLIDSIVFPDGSEILILRGDCQYKGEVWHQGTYTVRVFDIPGFRTKTFHGETAWSDAARYAGDAAAKKGAWGWSPEV